MFKGCWNALEKYAVFRGRAGRSEFWSFAVFSTLGMVGLAYVDIALGLRGTLILIYGLLILSPTLSVVVRRLHDTGRSGWWTWVGLVPGLGALVLLFFSLQRGQKHSNRYGHAPQLFIP